MTTRFEAVLPPAPIGVDGRSGPACPGQDSDFLPLVLGEETAVLIRWQRHAHSLAVELLETFAGWMAAAHYFRTAACDGFGGLCDIWRGPYPSRESAIRNTVAHLVHGMLCMGLSTREAMRIYSAAGMRIPARWRHKRMDEAPEEISGALQP